MKTWVSPTIAVVTLDRTPRILGLGGSTREGSTSERALRAALNLAERAGAHTDLLLALSWQQDRKSQHSGPERIAVRSLAEQRWYPGRASQQFRIQLIRAEDRNHNDLQD